MNHCTFPPSIISGSLKLALAASFLGLPSLAAAAGSGVPVPGSAPAIDLTKGKEIAEAVCIACHAADGNSQVPDFPILAAQQPQYLVKQLKNYKPGPNGETPARDNAIMLGFASALSDEDMANVSAFYAAQKLIPSLVQDAEAAKSGEQIYRAGIAAKGVPSCAGCHGPAGSGMPAEYPRISGQHSAYTVAQLSAFRDGVRNNSTQMSRISKLMSDADIKAVSEYLAGLR